MPNYTLEQVEEMFSIVGEVRSYISTISMVNCGDPRISCKEERKKLKELIPEYKKKIPKEIQEILHLTSKDLERMVD